MTDESTTEAPQVGKRLLLPMSVGQAILDYFTQRPYGEAKPFVDALLSLEELPQPENVE